MAKHHHKRLGGGWITLITLLVVGAVVGTILGIYFGAMNKADQYLPPPPKSSSSSSSSSASPEAMRVAAGADQPCPPSQISVNGVCQPLCIPKCSFNPVKCVNGSNKGLPDGCGDTCCGCSDKETCVNGVCVPTDAPKCNPGCTSGQTCVNGTCQPNSGLCSPACASNQQCVNNVCVCKPNCPSNSCGSDGCGGTCNCPSGTTCNTSNNTCQGCAPTCPANKCGGPDGCGGTCGCPGGQVCQNCACVTDTNPWIGWTTTTQFGSGEPTWGADPVVNEYLPKINDEANNRMGAAIPWRELCKTFGSKQNQIAAVVNSAAGKTSDKACFLVQPITAYPDQLSGVNDPFYPGASMCDPTVKQCVDINDPSIAAKDDSGKEYPSYLIFPYEGCGGNCKTTAGSGPDCGNDCLTGPEQAIGANCDFSSPVNPLCGAMQALYDNGKWEWNDAVSTNFMQYSDVYGISPDTKYGRDVSGGMAKTGDANANWCSGQNMHMDIALTTPYWIDRGMGNIAQTNATSNIVMRYKRVPCNYYGNLDVTAPMDPNIACPSGYYWLALNSPASACNTNGNSILNPGDPAWPMSGAANHACCGKPSNPTPSGGAQCGLGQMFQAPGGACPCPAGQCFFNTGPTLDGSKGLCGQCGTGPSACGDGQKC